MIDDFDTLIDRRTSDSTKWHKYGPDVIPMWVADMDFRSPPAVIDALKARVDHGIFGYGDPPAALVETVQARLASFYDWSIEPGWLVWLPGLVAAINAACRLPGEQESVLTATPVYHPFLAAPGNMGRALITVPMTQDNGRWTLDLERLEAAITPATRLLLLSHPHNPVGRAYSRAELTALAALCDRHDLIICSDEIHCELMLDTDKPHVPTATLGPEIAARTITLMAPSKTFNLAGLGCGFAIIPDSALRRRFQAATAGIVAHVNVLGYTAALAAYREGEAWHQALLAYLRGNRDRLAAWVAAQPGLRMSPTEATYLAWIDCRGAGLTAPAALFARFGVGVHDGQMFGAPAGFIRLNFGCPRSLLEQALTRMQRALEANDVA